MSLIFTCRTHNRRWPLASDGHNPGCPECVAARPESEKLRLLQEEWEQGFRLDFIGEPWIQYRDRRLQEQESERPEPRHPIQVTGAIRELVDTMLRTNGTRYGYGRLDELVDELERSLVSQQLKDSLVKIGGGR